jgi:hypothetical protein
MQITDTHDCQLLTFKQLVTLFFSYLVIASELPYCYSNNNKMEDVSRRYLNHSRIYANVLLLRNVDQKVTLLC